ncbi:outer membrane lipoprotein carrier protein LolA [Flavobacterium arcticum]|uniref:Outer membrane lipoprotein carrier protein LolA n=3 Tax=Flavobacterium arcticum TaxID=1784713 RepID=A0A345HD36_9FLAO|nr:outer membrane lipoprotein carrier protein LolA [Flavobacterium arcticum]KAF2512383.1 outer membrane lipoprotein carrier protein LolA [Flavobacterium arcticum]
MKEMMFNMQKSIKLIVLFILTFCFSANAQDSLKAKNLLDQVSLKVRSYNNIVLDFKYTVVNADQNLHQESKGNVALKGDQYVLNIMGITRIYDGSKVYNIVPEDEEISISTFDDQKTDELTPAKMFTFFNVGYKYTWDITQNIKGRKIQYIKLKPLDKNNTTKEVLIGIDLQTKHIYNLLKIDKDGTKTTFTINSFKTNQPLSKNHFTFTEGKYPNYYINRLD